MKTVLVVEDELIIGDMLRSVLEEEGYNVLVASNGKEALAQIEEGFHPDLVLCDVMMPVLDGRGLCNQIKRQAGYEHIPVVLMSAVPVSICKANCDFDAFVTKPFIVDALLDTIHTLIGDHTAPR